MMAATKSARDGLPRNTSEIGTETDLSREDRRQAEWGISTGGLRKKGGFFYFVLFLLLLLLLFEKTLDQNELKRAVQRSQGLIWSLARAVATSNAWF